VSNGEGYPQRIGEVVSPVAYGVSDGSVVRRYSHGSFRVALETEA
jgi:hypothetical protein